MWIKAKLLLISHPGQGVQLTQDLIPPAALRTHGNDDILLFSSLSPEDSALGLFGPDHTIKV